jgi:very-short-patch-repair endonuclease
VLSHETAAALLGLLDDPGPLIHVSVPTHRRPMSMPGVRLYHRRPSLLTPAGALEPPRTGAEDTVLDLTQTATDPDAAIGWLARACARRLTTPERLLTAIHGRRRLRWREALVTAVADVAAGCHSVLELRYLRDVERRHGLPAATRQRRRRPDGSSVYRDVEYEDFALLVELDGRAAHQDPWRDRRRDNTAATSGWLTLRSGWADVNHRTCETAALVAKTLHTRGWQGTPTPCPSCPTHPSGKHRAASPPARRPPGGRHRPSTRGKNLGAPNPKPLS